MSYLDQSRRASPASMAAVVAIHAAMGAALLVGLTVSGVIEPKDGPLIGIDLKDPPPPPPPPQPSQPDQAKPADPLVNVPTPRLDIRPTEPVLPTTDLILPPIPDPVPGLRTPDILPSPSPQPSFDAVGAKPRNDPRRWLSDADYKASWARQELVGLARYRLDIAADGRVTGCQITTSTGHSELDDATCALVTKRARFQPARDGNGDAVGGNYTGSVRWQLPRN